MDKKMKPRRQRPAESAAHPLAGQSPTCAELVWLGHKPVGAHVPPQVCWACFLPRKVPAHERENNTYLIRLYKIIIITSKTQFGSLFSSTDFSVLTIKLYFSFKEPSMGPLLSSYTIFPPLMLLLSPTLHLGQLGPSDLMWLSRPC